MQHGGKVSLSRIRVPRARRAARRRTQHRAQSHQRRDDGRETVDIEYFVYVVCGVWSIVWTGDRLHDNRHVHACMSRVRDTSRACANLHAVRQTSDRVTDSSPPCSSYINTQRAAHMSVRLYTWTPSTTHCQPTATAHAHVLFRLCFPFASLRHRLVQLRMPRPPARGGCAHASQRVATRWADSLPASCPAPHPTLTFTLTLTLPLRPPLRPPYAQRLRPPFFAAAPPASSLSSGVRRSTISLWPSSVA